MKERHITAVYASDHRTGYVQPMDTILNKLITVIGSGAPR